MDQYHFLPPTPDHRKFIQILKWSVIIFFVSYVGILLAHA